MKVSKKEGKFVAAAADGVGFCFLHAWVSEGLLGAPAGFRWVAADAGFQMGGWLHRLGFRWVAGCTCWVQMGGWLHMLGSDGWLAAHAGFQMGGWVHMLGFRWVFLPVCG